MKTFFTRAAILALINFSLTSCATDWMGTQDQAMMGTDDNIQVTSKMVSSGEPLGGYIEQYMDANDKIKMGRGLDGAIGKTTKWTNPLNGAEFAMTPTNKVGMEGARYCRGYNLTMSKKGMRDQVSGKACIGQDGSWHVVG